MISRKHLLRGSLAASAAGGAVRAGSARAADAFTLRMSLPTSPTTAWNVAFAQMATAIDRRSNGRLKIEMYPNSQLANQAASVTGLVSGTVDITQQTSVFFESFSPRFAVLDLPFMFRSGEAAFKVVDGPIGDELYASLEPKGIVGLIWAGSGFRCMETTTKAIHTPDDMKGLRMRIQAGQIYAALMQALGATPITIDAAEQFSALQQHVIDGIEPNIEQVLEQKLYPLIRHIAYTNHIFSIQAVVASKAKIDALPPDLQRILKEEAKNVRGLGRQLSARHITEAIQQLKGFGVEFTETNFAAFRRAVEPVYVSFAPRIGADFVDRVKRAANE